MKRIVSLVCLICLLFSVNVFADTTVIIFSDVSNSHWAKSYIDTFVQNGVVSGYTDGTFKPENNVTREEFCKLLVKTFDADGSYISSKIQTFADVEPNRWSYNDVEICRDFLTGYMNPFGGKPLFKPTDAATREDIAVALVKMLGYSEKDVSSYGYNIHNFRDSQSISPNLRNYVGFASSMGLINGYPDGTFGAQRGITRAETLVMLDRALKVSVADEYDDFDFGVELRYGENGKQVTLDITSNQELLAYVNGVELKLNLLLSPSGETKYYNSYIYTFTEEGEKTFLVEAKKGTKRKTKEVTAEYHINTPKIRITECPEETHSKSVTVKGTVSCEGVNVYDINFTVNDKKINIYTNEFTYNVSFTQEETKELKFEAEYLGRKATVEKEITYVIAKPEIELFNCPKEVSEKTVKVTGKIIDGNYYNAVTGNVSSHVTVMINNDKVYLDNQGMFSKEIKLENGINDIVIIASNDLGKTTKIEREIVCNIEEKEVVAPEIEIFDCPTEVFTNKATISGKVVDDNEHDTKYAYLYITLMINNNKVSVDSQGVFTYNLKLSEGKNNVSIIATNEFGKSAKVQKEIVYVIDEEEEKEEEKEKEKIIYSPEIELFNCPEKVFESEIKISGKVSDKNSYNSSFVWSYITLYINDEEVLIDKTGMFTEKIRLKEGKNTISFIATNELGKTTKLTKNIEYLSNDREDEEEIYIKLDEIEDYFVDFSEYNADRATVTYNSTYVSVNKTTFYSNGTLKITANEVGESNIKIKFDSGDILLLKVICE